MNPSLRKPTAALAAFLITIALVACGGGGGTDSGTGTGSGSDSGAGGGSGSGSGSGAGGSGSGGVVPVEKPAITTQPAGESLVVGYSATFTVTATGGGTLAYQWKKNGTDISGATSNTYTTPATTSADIGAELAYSVVVSNSGGSVTSDIARLTVTASAVKPEISKQPANLTVTAGQTASFSVSASGTSPLIYQWKKNGAEIPGATSSTYTMSATSQADSGSIYSVVVINRAGLLTSTDASLTVTPAPTSPAITTQPLAQTITAGQTASFSVQATGTSPIGYQWKKNGVDISGATASTYTTPATSNADVGAELAYSVVLTNSAGSATSTAAKLAVFLTPTIGTQPMAQTVTAGQSATFSVNAAGTSLSYQWWKNGTLISDATSNPYTTPATSIGDNNAVFKVVVSNSVGTVTSNEARLTVIDPPAITSQPAPLTITANQTANFLVTATGTAPLSYQWKRNGTNIPDATSNSYTTPAMSTGDSGAVYTVEVSNSARSITSSSATLTVNKSSTTGYSEVANASGGTYAKTECVKENSTGLIWEGKNPSGSSSRPGDRAYTNYDSTSSGQKANGSNPSLAEINADDNSISHLNSVNASELCGYTDWRLPTKDELLGILDTRIAAGYVNPRIDTTWFPNTQPGFYWSSTLGNPAYIAWYVSFGPETVGTNHGNTYRYLTYGVRLVR